MKKNAFTLIELSIVLVIIGLLIGGSFKIFQSMHDRAKVTRAKDDVQTAKNTILGYADTSNLLPSKANFDQNLSPIKSNQHQLLYVHDTALESKNICAFASTALSVKRDKQDGTSVTISNVAFVIVSESANHNMQTKLDTSTNTVEIHKPYTKVDDQPNPVNIVEPYDDVADWVTLDQLKHDVNCKSFRIANSSLPSTDTNSSKNYNAKIILDGNYSNPTAATCTFQNSASGSSNFQFNATNFLITNPTHAAETAGEVSVDCNITADGITRQKTFAITVNP